MSQKKRICVLPGICRETELWRTHFFYQEDWKSRLCRKNFQSSWYLSLGMPIFAIIHAFFIIAGLTLKMTLWGYPFDGLYRTNLSQHHQNLFALCTSINWQGLLHKRWTVSNELSCINVGRLFVYWALTTKDAARAFTKQRMKPHGEYFPLHSPGAGWAGITNWVDHVSDEGTPGSTVLCELTRHFHPVLSTSWAAEDSRSGEGLQVCLDCGCPCLQSASSSPAPRVRRCGQV